MHANEDNWVVNHRKGRSQSSADERAWREVSSLVPPALINAATVKTPANARIMIRAALEKERRCLQDVTAAAREISGKWAEPSFYAKKDDPRCEYRIHPRDILPSVHAGQLKLCLSELWLLTKAQLDGPAMVVYAGAAEGHHIPFLASLWPKVTFNLWDPRPFHESLSDVSNIRTNSGPHDGFFTDDVASRIKTSAGRRYPLIFISDIRSGNPEDPNCDFDKCVKDNMTQQRRWVETMRPNWSMLKFCLPYKPGKTEYLAPHDDKSMSYGVFATKSGTELRLVVKGDELKTCVYDNTEMEERSYYFNNFTRLCRYKMPGLKADKWATIGVDSCWDCRSMMRISLDYLAQQMGETHVEVVESIATVVHISTGMGINTASIIGQYVGVPEATLFDFIQRMIKACGHSTSEKLLIRPHVDLSHDQWIDAMHNYDGFLIHSKGRYAGWQPISSKADEMMESVYREMGNQGPALGQYAGQATKKAGDRFSKVPGENK